jgi:hypothetical protein
VWDFRRQVGEISQKTYQTGTGGKCFSLICPISTSEAIIALDLQLKTCINKYVEPVWIGLKTCTNNVRVLVEIVAPHIFKLIIFSEFLFYLICYCVKLELLYSKLLYHELLYSELLNSVLMVCTVHAVDYGSNSKHFRIIFKKAYFSKHRIKHYFKE